MIPGIVASNFGEAGMSVVGQNSALGASQSVVGVNYPAGTQAGDVLLLAIVARGTSSSVALATPAGWTPWTNSTWDIGNHVFGLYYRIAGAETSVSYNFTNAATTSMVRVVAYRGAEVASTPAAQMGSSIQNAGTTVNVPYPSESVLDGDWYVAMWTGNNTSSGAGSLTPALPPGFTTDSLGASGYLAQMIGHIEASSDGTIGGFTGTFLQGGSGSEDTYRVWGNIILRPV